MKVKLLTGRAGSDWSQDAGQVVEVSKEEGQRLVESGQAEPVQEKREKATQSSGEKR